MKPLMSCDSDGGAVTRTKAPLPLRELWFASEDDRESLWAPESPRRRRQESTYFTLQFISGGEWTGIWQQTKPIRAQLSGGFRTHTHTHTVIQSLLIIRVCQRSFSHSNLDVIQRQQSVSGDSNYLHHIFSRLCVHRGVAVFLTQPSSHLQAPQLRSQNCDFTTNSSHGEYIFSCQRRTNTTSGTLLVLKSYRQFLKRLHSGVWFVFERFQQVRNF